MHSCIDWTWLYRAFKSLSFRIGTTDKRHLNQTDKKKLEIQSPRPVKILDASSCNTSLPFLSFTISLIRPRLCSQRKNENYEHTPSRLKFLTIFTNREPEFDNYSSNLLVRTSFLPAYLATAYTVGVNFIHKFNLLKSFSIAFVVFLRQKA